MYTITADNRKRMRQISEDCERIRNFFYIFVNRTTYTIITMMKNISILLSLFISLPLLASPAEEEINNLLNRLDSLVAQNKSFEKNKEIAISQLRKQKRDVNSIEEAYWLNRKFYDEFSVYNADSALVYVEQNQEIARELGKKDWIIEWKIRKSFLLAATGLLKEASDELQGISGDGLSPNLRTDYYGQMIYLFSHFGQYSGENGEMRERYNEMEEMYKDSIYNVITPENPLYLWYKGWKLRNTEMVDGVKEELLHEVTVSNLETRRDAMNSYVLANLYKDDGNQHAFLKYMICSAMADVRTVNRDIASLEELAQALFDMGEIDRAYTYINYCLQNAQIYRNRIRVVGISSLQDSIHKAYQERNLRQEARLQKFLILVSILSVILLVAIFYIYRQMKNVSLSRTKLNEVNHLLNEHVIQLSQAHKKLEGANGQLHVLNEQLQDKNNQLRESNYVKEEYIGYVFSICSTYISKLDEFRKVINRKLKAKQVEDVKALTEASMVRNELKEFYNNFDAIFLHVYPDFVSDFNALLHPEEQIVLKEGELLNTDLRIYALVRLGINDSVKIAEFLHCSPQTVYNSRLKMRNRADIPKEEFADRVKSLGKMQE